MKKTHLQFDAEKLKEEKASGGSFADQSLKRIQGFLAQADGDDRAGKRYLDRAERVFNLLNKNHSGKKGFEWLDRIKRTDVGKSLDA